MTGDTHALIASYLQSAATVAAVILALFLQVFLVRLRRPALNLSVSMDVEDDDLVLAVRPDKRQDRVFIRGKVWAEKGKESARDAQVLLAGMTRPQSWPVTNPPALGAPLKWAELDAETVTIPSGAWRRVDLLQLWRSTASNAEYGLWTALQKTARQFPPGPRYYLTEPGEYILHLIVTAHEAPSSHWDFRFTYTPALPSSIEELVGQVSNIALVRRRGK